MTADENYRLLREMDANRQFMVLAYRDNPALLAQAEPRIRALLSPLSPGALPADDAIVATLRGVLPDLRAVYRYGSFGSVHARADSDIDLAVLADRRLSFDELSRLGIELMRLCGRDVDLNDMRRLPVTLRVQIVAGGTRLYAAPGIDEYDSRTLSDYARLNEERRGILEDVRRRGSIYG